MSATDTAGAHCDFTISSYWTHPGFLGLRPLPEAACVLAEARKGECLTQRDLAKCVDRPHSVIGMIESEQR